MKSYVSKNIKVRPYRVQDKKQENKLNMNVNFNHTYFPIMLNAYNFGIRGKSAMFRNGAFYDYFVELENYKSDIPHFHLNAVGPNGRMLGGTRTMGISLESGLNKGIVYFDTKNGMVLDDELAELVLMFVEENRMALLLMHEAFKAGKVKKFEGMKDGYDEDLKNMFTRNELAKLERKFNKLTNSYSEPEKL